MKKTKEVNAVKRKSDNLQMVASEAKKRKKHQNENVTSPGSSTQAQDIDKSIKTPTAIKIGKKNRNMTTLMHKKVVVQKKEIVNQTKVSNRANGAEGTPASNRLNPKKKKELKKKLQQANTNGASSLTNRLASTSDGTEDRVKKKKKKKKKNKLQDQSINNKSVTFSNTDTDTKVFANSTDASKHAKKKKKNKVLNENPSSKNLISSNTGNEASVNSTDASKQVKKKKKKKKNKLHHEALNVSSADGSESSSPSTTLQKKIKNKPFNKNEKNTVYEGKSPILAKESKKGLGQAKPNTSKLIQKGNKPAKFGHHKELNVKGTNTNTGETFKLKGKALKRHIANIIKAISKVKELQNSVISTLANCTTEEKEKKRLKRLKKIELRITKLESDLSVYRPGKNSTKIGNLLKFKNLPEGPQLKKNTKRVELKDFLEKQMKSSRFRWLNENLYTSSSDEAQGFFKEDPESFKAYHEGYSEQVAKWPVNPLDVIIKELKSLPKETVVADLGCGEAKLAAALPKLKVHSLDFIALKPEVIACDMAHCPLLRSSVDVVVFCLSLMGTNVSDFLLEANRILKTGGTMEIAEVESRFDSIDDFIEKVQKYGFNLKKKNPTDMFFFLSFTKKHDVAKTGKLPDFELKACVYKKR